MIEAFDAFKYTVGKCQFKMKSFGLRVSGKGIRCRVPLYFEVGNFIVKTLSEIDELENVLALRYDVFHKEFRKKTFNGGVDVDKFDFLCDHLIILEKNTRRVVGTYRLISSRFSHLFYSESEFHLNALFAEPGAKLELGRACIHKDFRKGTVIALLWRGISEYILKTDTAFLFGCGSVKTTSIIDAGLMLRYFKQKGFWSDEYGIHPTKKYVLKNLYAEDLELPLSGEEWLRAESLVPSLLQAYFKAGAKICGLPALDREFQCLDFLTVLQTQLLAKSFERKYKVSK